MHTRKSPRNACGAILRFQPEVLECGLEDTDKNTDNLAIWSEISMEGGFLSIEKTWLRGLDSVTI